MSVSYESAMATLSSMFGDVDREVIAMILQANGGHMENSVEHLLALSGGGGGGAGGQAPRQQAQQQQPPRQAPQPQRAAPAARPFPAHMQPQPSPPQQHQQQQYPVAYPSHPYYPQQQPLPYGVPQPYGYPHAPAPVPYPVQQSYPPQPYQPHPAQVPRSPAQPPQQSPPPQQPPRQQPSLYSLPDDFLRPPSYFEALVGAAPAAAQPAGAAVSGPAAPASADVQSQIEQDHLLAQMLMDEEFMRDLAANPDRYQAAASPAASALQRPQQPKQEAKETSSPKGQSQATPRMAPAAHPHPDFDSRERAGSSASTSAAAAAASASHERKRSSAAPVVLSPTNALGAASGSTSLGSEPLHPHLRALESTGPGSSSTASSGLSKEQQSTFASRWSSLTAAAREKLARLSERFKNQPLHDSDLDAGGDYKPMSGESEPLRERMAPLPSVPDDGFLSPEEAARLQAGYNAPAPAKAGSDGKSARKHKSNPFVVDDEADPFGAGANGSGGESDDELPVVSSSSQLQRPPSVSRLDLVPPQRTVSELARVEARGADDDEYDEDDDAVGSYQPPRLLSGEDNSAVASPSNVNVASASGGSFFGLRRPSGAGIAAGSNSPPSGPARVPGARKRSTAEAAQTQKDKAMPLLQDM